MKKIIFTLFSLCLCLSLSAQLLEIPETQRSLITKRTADWCTNCGAWGWTLFEGLLEDNNDNALLIAAHHSGGLQNSASSAITSNFGGFSQPRFYFNNEDVGANSSNAAQTRTDVEEMVNTAAQEQPVVQTGLSVGHESGTLGVYAKARFFQATEGEFYLAIYLIQKEYIGYQAVQGSDALHKQLLRELLTEDPFGVEIANGTITSGTEEELNLTFDLEDYDTENIEIAAVIWEKQGEDEFQFVNVNSTTEILSGFPVGTREENFVGEFQVFPNLTSGTASVQLNLPKSARSVNLKIIDQNGQLVKSIFDGSLEAGDHRMNLQENLFQAAGLYYVHILVDGTKAVRKLIISQ